MSDLEMIDVNNSYPVISETFFNLKKGKVIFETCSLNLQRLDSGGLHIH